MISVKTANKTFLVFIIYLATTAILDTSLSHTEAIYFTATGLAACFLFYKFSNHLTPMLGRPTMRYATKAVMLAFLIQSATELLIVTFSFPAKSYIPGEYSMIQIILIFITFSVFIPIIEEIIFRGVVFNGYRTVFSVFVTTLITTTLFAIWHLNLYQAIHTWLAGFIWIRLLRQTDNLWTTIISHGTSNFLAYLLYFTNFRAVLQVPFGDQVIVSLLVFSLTIALMLFLTHVPKTSGTSTNSIGAEHNNYKVLASPLLIIAVLICLFSIYIRI